MAVGHARSTATAAFCLRARNEDGEYPLPPASLNPADPTARRFSGDEAFLPDQRDQSQRDAGVELGVVVEGKSKATKL